MGSKKTLSKQEFLELLDELKALVEADDSMEGNLAYQWGKQPGEYEVTAALRTGNAMGQGGIRLVRGDL